MEFFSKKARATPRPSSPLSLSFMTEVTVVEPMAPVKRQYSDSFLSRLFSEAGLLEVYDEELFIERQATPEDEYADQASPEGFGAIVARPGGDRIILAGLVFAIQSTFVTHEAPATPTPVNNPKQLCRPYPEAPTVLFDSCTPDETSQELALRSIFDPSDCPVLFMRPMPIKPIAHYTPTPELFDTSDLRVRPVLATPTPVCDPVAQMLDLNSYHKEPHGTAPEYVAKHGRALMRPPPVCSDSDDEELDSDITTNEHDQTSKRRDSNVGSCPRDWEVEYDRVLRRITSYAFLPGLDHLTNIESRSAFITYDKDTQKLQAQAQAAPASEPVAHVCRIGTCTCVVHKVDATETAADVELFKIIDDIVDDELFVNDNVLDETTSTPQPLYYVDAETQLRVDFNALSHFTGSIDDAETLPRIHRSGDDFDNEDLDLVEVFEIGGLPPRQDDELSAVVPPTERTMLSILKAELQAHVMLAPSMRSRFNGGFGWTKYKAIAPLATLMEEVSDEDHRDHAPPSPSSSEASIDFADPSVFLQPSTTRRANFMDDEDFEMSGGEEVASSFSSSETSIEFEGQPIFVQPLATRRCNFMDEEDAKDDVITPYPPSSSDPSDTDSLYSMPVPTVVTNLHGFFDASIWHEEPELQLTCPTSFHPQSADLIPDPVTLDDLETEIDDLVAYMLDSIAKGRFDELIELGSVFRWVTSTIASAYPSLSSLEDLGEDIELFVARVVALGTS